ncbi:DoxX-like family protein [Psychrobacillus sp. OK028]|uniref:DoxX-like family protein n=1 Tax=Psychrobacillus sp. OK028 TaxID=1884359 RepID=UPI00089113F7|nr:DoxX-like family protein [Psychrobacillus sp. OK028]SDM89976.1 DoxX-like family protein [Psychrobacillus sp. OK028]
MKNKPIYVEISINENIERVWEATQNPNLHEQWDLRFSSITYLPKEENEAQLFEYKTNIGFGFAIEGWGKSVGTFHAKDDSRTSSLHFGTDHLLSPIKEGKGYWKYVPENNTTKFITQYDYDAAYGAFGKLLDSITFRPVIGWATALSFDVLKRWLEKGDTPSTQFTRFFTHWIITFQFFFVWIYQGLVPKLIMMHPEEVALTSALLPLKLNDAHNVVAVIGIIEIIFGLIWILYRNKRRLLRLQLVLLPLLTIFAITADSSVLSHPFNPATFNLSLIVLTIIGLLSSKDIPTARSCNRVR